MVFVAVVVDYFAVAFSTEVANVKHEIDLLFK